MHNTQNFVTLSNGIDSIQIDRDNPPPIGLTSFLDNDWASYGHLHNPNDQRFFPNCDINTVLTIYDKINSSNNIRHYNYARLRPQLSIPRTNYAISVVNNFFNDTSLIADTIGETSGGMTGHCIFRHNSNVYIAYVSMNSGPYAIDIIDPDFIYYIDPQYNSSNLSTYNLPNENDDFILPNENDDFILNPPAS